MAQCTAQSKQSGERCKRAAAIGRTVCVMHGGKSPVGPASPSWVDGRYSRVLPKRMLESYQASLRDPDKLTLNAELGLLDARLADVLQRADAGDAAAMWRALGQAFRQYEAVRTQDPERAAEALRRIRDLISRGQGDAAAWAEARELVQERRKLVESERKRLVQAQEMMHRDQVLALMGLVADSVAKHVHDGEARAAIVADVVALTGG